MDTSEYLEGSALSLDFLIRRAINPLIETSRNQLNKVISKGLALIREIGKPLVRYNHIQSVIMLTTNCIERDRGVNNSRYENNKN